MDFEKKILVLKQVVEGFSVNGRAVSGIFRLEIENGVATFSLSVINLSAVEGGCFYLYILDDKRTLFAFELGKRPFSHTKVLEVCPVVKKGLAVGVSFIKDNIPTLVAFASENDLSADMSEFKKTVLDKCITERRAKKTSTVQKYDDEVVATENYYLNDGDLSQKIAIIERIDDEYVRSQDGKSFYRGEETAEEKLAHGTSFQNETASRGSPIYNERNPYYRQAKPELDALFLKFPQDEALSLAVLNSKWVRVNYSETKYYVVGLVKENGKERYICYGVPAKYSPEPPEELKGFCSFIPLSVFDLKGDGYWMMFQDAITGECVKKD